MLQVLPLLVVALPGAPVPETAPAPHRAGVPALRFLSASKTAGESVRITFEVTNDRDKPVHFFGWHTKDRDRIEPLWIVDSRRDGEWETLRDTSSRCGYGFGFFELPAKATVTFDIELAEGQWDEARVLVRFVLADKTAAWRTAEFTRQQVEKALKVAPPRKE
jgi:hypothetical protein